MTRRNDDDDGENGDDDDFVCLHEECVIMDVFRAKG